MSEGFTSNEGPGWGDTATPYGNIHNYNPNEFGDGAKSGGNGSSSDGGSFSGTFSLTGLDVVAPGISTGDLAQIINNTVNWEGLVHGMYVDTEGNITVGVGTLVPSLAFAKTLTFFKRESKSVHGDEKVTFTLADSSTITNAYNSTLDIYNDTSLNYNQKMKQWVSTSVVMSDQAIGELVAAHISQDRIALENLYPNFDHYPQIAKIALHDMMYNLGPSRLKNEFPKFNAAVVERDWVTAAAESHRKGISDNRNETTRQQLLSAAK